MNIPTNELSEADRNKLAAVADAVTSAAPKVSEMSAAISDQLVHRAGAATADVHAHALAVLANCKERITHLEEAIRQSRDNTQKSITEFVSLVNDSIEITKLIDVAVAKIGDNVLRP